MRRLQQRADAGDVRRGHRRARHEVEVRPWLNGGATAATTSMPGAAMSGLRMSPPVVVDGPRDEKSVISGTCGAAASSAAVSGTILAVASAPAERDVGLDGGAVDVGDVDRRHRVVVAVERVGVDVGEDHADAAGALDLEALVDRALTPRSQTTILPAALAGSSVPAKHRFASASAAAASLTLAAVTSGVSVGDATRGRRADVAGAVAELDGLEGPPEGRRRDRGQPRRRVVERAGAGAAVAGRVGDEDAGVRGAAEGLLDRVEDVGLGRAADRVVEDVDAVERRRR